MTGTKRRLLDQVRDRIRLQHYSVRTEVCCVDWIRRFVLFHEKRHPAQMSAPEIEVFLTHLAVVGRVAASTQNQAKSALLFLYREVPGSELPWLDNIESAKAACRARATQCRKMRVHALAQIRRAASLFAGCYPTQ